MFDVEMSRRWQNYVAAVRGFFVDQDFIELRTPNLVPSPGMEPHLQPFKTELKMGREVKTFYLPTSPEFHLKKALTRGWTNIFEIKECFRNGTGELGVHHQPEFLMLEWYRAHSDLEAILKDTKNLISRLSGVNEFQTVTVRELFQKFLSFQLTPKTSLKELHELAQRNGIFSADDDSWNDVYFRIFLEKIEPELGKTLPTFLRDYPPSQAALAKLTSEGWADRFELYWKGLEIANAYNELTDASLQRARFQQDLEEKQRLGFEAVPVDEEFLKALESGMPPSGGIALGLERLFMAINDIQDIRNLRAFPLR